MTKQQLRKEIALKRSALEPAWITSASQRILATIVQLAVFEAARCVALYRAIAGEVDLNSLFSICWTHHKHTCIPVFNRTSNTYDLAKIDATTTYKTGNYGIQEPESPALLETASVDLAILPGVAFDSNGNRLGRGGGYYDRLLKDFSGIKAAVAFDFQLTPEIPVDLHDVPVDWVITETKTIKVDNEH